MLDGDESSDEAIAWTRSLIERFDAIVVVGPTGEVRFELAGRGRRSDLAA